MRWTVRKSGMNKMAKMSLLKINRMRKRMMRSRNNSEKMVKTRKRLDLLYQMITFLQANSISVNHREVVKWFKSFKKEEKC
jgi:hypothetical protein